MAYYELGKVIRMRRNAIGCGREAFDAGGPAGMTLYRIEKGKSSGTERTYRKLTKSMGVEESTQQGILKTSSMSILHLVNDIAKVFRENDDEKAEQMLSEIESNVDTGVPRNKQYIEWTKAKLQYRKKQISAEEYEKAIRKALSYTIPQFDEIDLKEWPFHEVELKMLIALNDAMKAQKSFEEQKSLLDEMRGVLARDYMNEEYKVKHDIGVRLCLSDVYGNTGKHRLAIQMDWESIGLSEKYNEFCFLESLYYDIHWNYWELNKKETLSEQEKNQCRQCLLTAYYISKARGICKTLYKRRIQERYPEELQ